MLLSWGCDIGIALKCLSQMWSFEVHWNQNCDNVITKLSASKLVKYSQLT